MKTAFVIIALLAFAVATGDESASDVLIDQVENIEQDVQTQIATHKALYEAQQVECAKEIAFRQGEIDEATDAYNASQTAQLRCENAQVSANVDLGRNKAYILQLSELLSQLAFQRASEESAFHRLVDFELTPAIQAIQGVYPLLNEFSEQAPSFVQISSHLNSMLLHMIKANRGAEFGNILVTLLQSSQEEAVSGDVIEQLNHLFDSLEETLQQQKLAAIEAEQASVDHYNELVSNYTIALANLNSVVSFIQSYLDELQACIDTETGVSSQAAAKEQHNSSSLAHAVDMCLAQETEYANALDASSSQLSLLGKLKSFIEEQAEAFGDFGIDNIDAEQEYLNTVSFIQKSKRSEFIQKILKKASNPSQPSVQCKSCPASQMPS